MNMDSCQALRQIATAIAPVPCSWCELTCHSPVVVAGGPYDTQIPDKAEHLRLPGHVARDVMGTSIEKLQYSPSKGIMQVWAVVGRFGLTASGRHVSGRCMHHCVSMVHHAGDQVHSSLQNMAPSTYLFEHSTTDTQHPW